MGVHIVTVDGVGLALKELANHLDGAEIIWWEVAHPAQVVGVVRVIGCQRIRETSLHRPILMGTHGHRAKAEVRWIMLKEDPEPTQAIRSHSTPRNDTGKGNGLTVLLLQGEQAGPIAPGILAGQVAHLQALDPHATALAS